MNISIEEYNQVIDGLRMQLQLLYRYQGELLEHKKAAKELLHLKNEELVKYKKENDRLNTEKRGYLDSLQKAHEDLDKANKEYDLLNVVKKNLERKLKKHGIKV
jgi:chromosome segregation ATPase